MGNKDQLSEYTDAVNHTKQIIKSSISHDINTPLTYIKGNLEMLRLEIEGCQSNKAEEHIAAIFEGLDKITQAVDIIKYMCDTDYENIQKYSVE